MTPNPKPKPQTPHPNPTPPSPGPEQEALGSASEVFSLLERGEAEVAAEAERGGPLAADEDEEDAPCPIASSATSPAAHGGPRGELLFEAVDFEYPSRPDVRLLRALQLPSL